MLNAGGVTNLYDAMNNRIGQFHGSNAVQYVVDPNWGLPRTLMSIKNGVTNYYVYGTGLLYQVTEISNGETTLTYHYDYRGSTVALTDDSGAVKDRFEYSLYGTMTYRAGTEDTPFLFNGRYGVMTDPNGLLYMNARYYSPYICRFLNPDSSGFSGGLNFYAYANGNPVSYIDPFGLCADGNTEGWGGTTATWLQNNVVNPLNSISTRSTAANFGAYMAGSVVNGLADLLRLGQGTAYATYNAQDGWDVAIGITQDIGRAAGISLIVGGGLEGLTRDTVTPPSPNTPEPTPSTAGFGNISGGATTAEQALGQAQQWLGPGYSEIAPGVYRSADGLRQFRMTTSDLTDAIQGPHVHFEAIGPDGHVIIENSHVQITNP